MAVDEGELRRAERIVREAERVVVLTGAGISAESGIPTFRGPEGLWRQYRPEELATPEAFARDPRLVWEWYDWRRQRIAACHPNAAHLALARSMLRRGGIHILTQNVDALHSRAAVQAAGEGDASAAMPLKLHGSIFRARCVECDKRTPLYDDIDTQSVERLPRCQECGGLLRPDVVWFGESLDRAILERAFQLAGEADVCVIIGTSGLVQPTASLPGVTQSGGGRIIEINPEPTPLTAMADLSLRSGAASAAPRLFGGPKLSGPLR